jgi:hypothetical protein
MTNQLFARKSPFEKGGLKNEQPEGISGKCNN